MQNKKGFRMWKSGKTWLFASGIMIVMMLNPISMSKTFAETNTEFTHSLNTKETSDAKSGKIDQFSSALPEDEQEVYSKNELSGNVNRVKRSLITTYQGTVADKKTTVSRTSPGISVDNPTADVKKLEVKWDTNESNIVLKLGTSYTVNTPFIMNVETTRPLAKGEKVEIPLTVEGTIFNPQGEKLWNDFGPNIEQNNGNYYISKDKNFSYDYDRNTGMLIITALTDASFSKFTDMTYYLDNSWVPVPLNRPTYPLPGGVKGNYGVKGSGAKIEIGSGGQKSSETVTNTEDIDFSETIPAVSESIMNGQTESSQTVKARHSNNFIASAGTVLYQTRGGKNAQLLDGSVDHYKILPTKNAILNKDAKENPLKAVRFEQYNPMGSSGGYPQSVISGGIIMDEYAEEYGNIIKNVKYNETDGSLEFDMSRTASDWAKMATGFLNSDKFYGGQMAPWMKQYFTEMATNNNSQNQTPRMVFYPIAPQNFIPINNNLEMSADVTVKNSKTGKTITQHKTVTPINAGGGQATQATVTALYVDENTGEAIDVGSESKFFDPGTGYNFTPPALKGYKYVAKNDSKIIEKIGATNIVDDKGKVTTNMVGKDSYIVYSYTKGGTIVTSYKDTIKKKLKPSLISKGDDGETVKTKPEVIENYVVKDVEVPDDAEVVPETFNSSKSRLKRSLAAPSAFAATSTVEDPKVDNPILKVKAGENFEVNYIYDNQAPVTYSVIDNTENKTLTTMADFGTATLGENFNSEDNKKKLEDIKNELISKGYKIETVENGDLPQAEHLSGYDIKIQVLHDTITKVVPGKDAETNVPDRRINQDIMYYGLPKDKEIPVNNQLFIFTATVEQTIDKVNNKVLSEAAPVWSEEQYSQEIKSPDVTGYTVNKPTVVANKYTYDSQNTTIPVNYKAIDVPITYTVIDDTIGQTILNKETLFTKPFDSEPSKTGGLTDLNNVVKDLESKNYSVEVKDNKDLPKIESVDGYDVKIHVTHKEHTKVVPGPDAEKAIANKTINQSVTYKGLPDSKTPETVKASYTFTSTVEQTIDSVTGKVLSEAAPVWSEAQTSKAIKTPDVVGYTPDTKEVAPITFQHDSNDSNTTVTYEAVDVPITYSVIDDTDKKSIITKEDFYIGKFDSVMNTTEQKDKLNNIIGNYEKKGYEVKNVVNGDLPVIDNISGYDIELHLTHGNHTKTVDGKDAENVINDRIITNTITYEGLPKSRAIEPNVQEFTFTSTVEQTIDSVTGDVLSEAEPVWSGTQTSKTVKTPDVMGYTTDTTEVASQNITYQSKNSNITVIYKAIDIPITYSVIDDTANKVIENKSKLFVMPFDSTPGDNEHKQLSDKITDLEKSNYEVQVTENENLPIINDINGYDVVIHVKHKFEDRNVSGNSTEAITKHPNRKVTQTIEFDGLNDKSKTPKPIKEIFEFESEITQTVDLVTKEIIKESNPRWSVVGSTATEANSTEITPPTIPGYSLDEETVNSYAYTADSKDKVITVHYKANPATVKVVYRDIDTLASKPNKVIKYDKLEGYMDENWSNKDKQETNISELSRAGYDFVSSDKEVGTYGTNEETVFVNFKHRMRVEENYEFKDVTKSIHYMDERGNKVADDVYQIFHFSNSAVIDEVTGEKVGDNWNSTQTSKEVKSPTIKGYTPSIINGDANGSTPDLIKAEDFTHESDDSDTTVVYTANAQKINIKFIDVDGLDESEYQQGKEITDTAITVEGKTDEEYDNYDKIDDSLNSLKDKGYNVVKVDTNSQSGIFGSDESTYYIYLNHNTETVKGGRIDKETGKPNKDYNHKVKQTIKYVGIDNISDNVQEFEFTDNVIYDLVTGDVLDVDKDKENKSSTTVTSPTVTGYTSDTPSVGVNTYNSDSEDAVIEVNYTKDPEDKPIETAKEKAEKIDKELSKTKGKKNDNITTNSTPKSSEADKKADIKTGVTAHKSIIGLASIAAVIGSLTTLFFFVKKKK